MGIKDIKDLLDLIGRYPLQLIAYLVDLDLRQATDLDDEISVGDIVDDVRHSETDAEADALQLVDVVDEPPTPDRQADSPSATAPTLDWRMLWAYMRALPGHRYYAVAVSVLSLAATLYTIVLWSRSLPVPTPIFVGALAGWLALPAVPSVHHAVRRFNFIETTMLSLSALLMIGGGTIELLAQQDGLDAVSSPSRAQWACLGIPTGMIWLGVVLAIVAAFGTTGSRRQLALPAWVAITVGCVATYVHTHAENNLFLAVASVFAAVIAARPRRRNG